MQAYPVSTPKASLIKPLVLLCLFAMIFVLSACATTDVRRPQGTMFPNQQGQMPNTPTGPVEQTPKDTKPQEIAEKKQEEIAAKDADIDENRMSRPGFTPGFMDGQTIKRIALILPFSAKSERLRDEAGSMLHAAELALFNRNDDTILLMALDSAGTRSGAREAAKKAVDQGADMILGPILASSVKASGQVARAANIPLIGFSTDRRAAGNGVYLLSFPPEAEVRRVTEYISQSGATRFAYLGPSSRYGQRVLAAYQDTVAKSGGTMAGVEQYSGSDISVMQEPAGRLARTYTQAHQANEAAGNPNGPAAFHVVLMPEGGTALRSLAPLLPFFEEEINPSSVQFIGTGLWNRDDIVREPALRGGMFAGPDRHDKQVFVEKYDAVFGQEPSRLASLAYDGVSIAAFVADGPRKSQNKRLTDPAGFFGVDGLVRFNSDGDTDRGLAVYQIKNGRFYMVDPAPKANGGVN